MKINLSIVAIASVLAFAPMTASAHAGDDTATPQSFQGPTAHQTAPYGYAVAGPGERIIRITSATRFINVTRLETVRIDIDGKSVVWNFDTLGTRAFPLSKIFPSAANITVYVEDSPLYRGG